MSLSLLFKKFDHPSLPCDGSSGRVFLLSKIDREFIFEIRRAPLKGVLFLSQKAVERGGKNEPFRKGSF
jgi:hypothetical protein